MIRLLGTLRNLSDVCRNLKIITTIFTQDQMMSGMLFFHVFIIYEIIYFFVTPPSSYQTRTYEPIVHTPVPFAVS